MRAPIRPLLAVKIDALTPPIPDQKTLNAPDIIGWIDDVFSQVGRSMTVLAHGDGRPDGIVPGSASNAVATLRITGALVGELHQILIAHSPAILPRTANWLRQIIDRWWTAWLPIADKVVTTKDLTVTDNDLHVAIWMVTVLLQDISLCRYLGNQKSQRRSSRTTKTAVKVAIANKLLAGVQARTWINPHAEFTQARLFNKHFTLDH